MKISKTLLIFTALLFYLSGCATAPRARIKLPSSDISTYNNIKTQEGVSVAVEILNKQRTGEIFGINLIAKNIQPIYVIIKNDSDCKYWFSKAGSIKDFIPAHDVHRRVYEGVYDRFLHGGTLGMIRWPFLIPGAIIDKTKAVKVEKSMKDHEEELKEIPDSHIQPGGEIQGIMFIPIRPEDKLILKITNSKNLKKEEFIFER